MKKEICNYGLIVLGSVLYAIATVAFIFTHSLLLGVIILISSFIGLLIKTFGIDFVI